MSRYTSFEQVYLRIFEPIGDGLQDVGVLGVGIVKARSINENDFATVVLWMRATEGLNFMGA